MIRRGLAAALLVATLTSCAVTMDDDRGSEPEQPPEATAGPDLAPVGEVAPAIELTATPPQAFDEALAVDPGWSEPPREVDGRWVGWSAGDGGTLVVTDSTGLVQAHVTADEAEGWTLTRDAQGTVQVVVVDEGEEGRDISAYGLDGARLWGPVDAPGELVGPGAVLEDGSRRTALDTATGDARPLPDAVVVLGEQQGVLLVQEGDDLVAHAADDAELWRRPVASLGLPAGAEVALLDEGATSPGLGILVTADEPTDGPLVDLTSGESILPEARAARRDEVLDLLVVLDERSISGHDAGEVLWSAPAEAGTRLSAVGGVLAYLRVGDAVQVRNALTGAEASVYDEGGGAGFAVPTTVSGTGAAVVVLDRPVLLTVQDAPGEE